MDWCNTEINGTQLDPHDIYKTMVGVVYALGCKINISCNFQSDALNKTGSRIWLNSCEWGVDNPWEWMRKYANSWRTTHDHHDDWGSTARAIEANADLGKYAGKKSFVEND